MRVAIIVLSLCSLAHAANGFVQACPQGNGTGPVTSITLTCGSNLTAGNTVTIHVTTVPFTFTVMNPTIKGSTCYPLRFADGDQTQGASTLFLSDFICPNVAGGSNTIAVTVNINSGTVDTNAFAMEWSGLGTWPKLDQAPASWPNYGQPAGGFGSSASGTTMSATQTFTAGSLVIAFGAGSSGTSSCSAGSGMTQPANGSQNSNWLYCIEYNLSATAGNQTITQILSKSQKWDFHVLSLVAGSTPYTEALPPSNGDYIVKGPVGAFRQHATTDAFPALATLPNGCVGLQWRLAFAGGQGSAGDAATAFSTTCNGGSTWTDYSGTSYGTDCHSTSGCVYSGDGVNADLIWGPCCLATIGNTVYQQITVLTSGLGCVEALLGKSTNSGAQWNAPITVDSNSACWMGNMISVPGGGVSSLCPSGCLIAPINENRTFKFLFSTDDGNTWGNPVTITGASLFYNQSECGGWYDSANTIDFLCRSAAGQPLRWARTTDFGTSWTGGYTGMGTTAAITSFTNVLTNPVSFFPGTGDGRMSVTYGDRNTGQILVTNLSWASLLANPSLIGNGQSQIMTQVADSNTFGYSTAAQYSGKTWLFAWYQPNAGSQGQIDVMQGTFQSAVVTPSAQILVGR